MKRYNNTITAKSLARGFETGKYLFDNFVQRGYTWDNNKKSLLIHSILYGYDITGLYFQRLPNGDYSSLDGKQRTKAIYDYINGKFPLLIDGESPIKDEEGKEYCFNNYYFDQLPEWARDRILDYNITLYYYESMDDAEAKEFFRRKNNGKPLSAIELTRVQAPCMDFCRELAKCAAISAAITPTGKKRFADEQLVLHCLAAALNFNQDFSSANIRNFARKLDVSTIDKDKIVQSFEQVNNFLNMLSDELEGENDISKESQIILKKATRKNNFIAIFYKAYLSINQGDTNTDEFIDTIYEFFKCGKPSKSEMYNNACGNGSAKIKNVRARLNAIASFTI